MQPLHPDIKTVWRLKLGTVTAVLTLLVLSYEIFHLFDPNRTLWFGVLTGGVLVVGLVMTFVLPDLRYRYWRYALRAEELYLQRGIINRVRTIVPLRRIQHLDVSQDVYERNYDLGKLIVHTAGTRSSDVILPGLAMEDAEALRDTLKHYITEDAV